jgi:site-specific recombinase XerD
MIQSGVDIKTLQILLGHKNIATTEKYLKGLRIADLQQKIENSSLAAMLT